MKALIFGQNIRFIYHIATCLEDAGWQVYAIGAKKSAAVCRLSRRIHRYTYWPYDSICSPTDADVDRLNAFCERKQIDLIVPADLHAGKAIGGVQDRLVRPLFPVSDIQTLDLLHDKWQFACFLRELGVCVPQSQLITCADDAAAINIAGRLVTKELNNEGSKGQAIYESADELRAAISKFDENDTSHWPLLVQEFVPGTDYGINILARHGEILAWTVQKHLKPGELDFYQDDRILELTRKIVKASGYHGVANFDIRLDSRDNQLKYFECNPRFWGSLLYSFWAGVNFAHLGALVALGQDPQQQFSPIYSRCTEIGIAPRKLLASLAQGEWVPSHLPLATQNAWRTGLTDPVVNLYISILARVNGRKAAVTGNN